MIKLGCHELKLVPDLDEVDEQFKFKSRFKGAPGQRNSQFINNDTPSLA